MMRTFGALRVTDRNQRLLQQLLQVRLPDVDDVIHIRGPTEERMAALPATRTRCPQRPLRAALEYAVLKILAEQSKLPELIGDVLPDVGNDAIRADDDFFPIFFVFDQRLF